MQELDRPRSLGKLRSLMGDACDRFGLAYLLVFDSRVSGRPDSLSDWDFAARYGRTPSVHEIAELANYLAERLSVDSIDVVVLDDPNIPPPLLYEALWKGLLLYVGDREAYRWDRVRALSMYHEYVTIFKPGLREAVRWFARSRSSL